jgi:hypothetical protein
MRCKCCQQSTTPRHEETDSVQPVPNACEDIHVWAERNTEDDSTTHVTMAIAKHDKDRIELDLIEIPLSIDAAKDF